MLVRLQGNRLHREYFSEEFRRGMSKVSDKSAVIFAPAIAPIAEMNGLLAMWELRRRLLFPDALRDNTRIRLESDVPKTVTALVKHLEAGSLVIVPTSAVGVIADGVRVVGNSHWSLYRIGARPTDQTSSSR
jgi:hypothetical protein